MSIKQRQWKGIKNCYKGITCIASWQRLYSMEGWDKELERKDVIVLIDMTIKSETELSDTFKT